MHLIAFNFFLRAIMDVITLYRHAETRVASQLITRLDTLFLSPSLPQSQISPKRCITHDTASKSH